MANKLVGKIALVTGGGSGSGESTARLFAAEGAQVVVADIDHQNALRVAKSVGQDGGKAVAIEVDVSQWKQVESMRQTAFSA